MSKTAFILWSIAAALTLSFVPSQDRSTPAPTSAVANLDPRLQIMQHQYQQFQKYSGASVAIHGRESNQPVVGLLVRTQADAKSMIESLGGAYGSAHGDIHTVRVPLPALSQLATDRRFDYLEASRVLYPELTSSVPQTGATALHRLPGEAALTGKGVIVGICDTGIDWTHADFKHADGTSRILYLWDQFLEDLSTESPEEFDYGSEYSGDQINAGEVGHRETSGHGTHVASIAAGNGLSTGPFIGMAPEADIIAVRGNLISPVNGGAASGGFLDGYAYIRTKAEALGKRHVVNTSFGTTLGPHDGTTLYEQAINFNVGEGSILVNSAGNYANDNWHAEAVVTAGDTVVLRFNAPDDDNLGDNELQVDIWYETNDRLDVMVVSPTAGAHQTVKAGEANFFDSVDGFLSIISITESPLNGDNEIFIQIDRSGTMTDEITGGLWEIHLWASAGNELPDGGEFDAWTERDDNATFGNFIDIEETINYPGCADSVIAVASYANAGGTLSGFSSRGPRRDGVNKPEIAAIGGSVVAARSNFSERGFAGDSVHTNLSGTSMSAPHVTGAIALLLQADPTLTPAQVRNKLLSHARADANTGPLPNQHWGHGKLDIFSPLLPYISTINVQGTIADETTGATIEARLSFRLLASPFEEPIAVVETVGGAFTLAMPPGDYEMEVDPEIPYPLVRQVVTIADDQFDLSQQLSPAEVVIVNDDPAGDFSEFYTSALDSLERSYSLHPLATKGALTLDALPDLIPQPLIWLTGNASGEVLTDDEQALLAALLDQGGRLFLTGQNIAESLTGSSFLDERLHLDFEENIATDFLLHGVQTNPVGKDMINIITTGTLGANNQTSRDALIVSSGAEPAVVFDLATGQVAGVTIADPANGSKTVFFGFGFEAINAGAAPRPGFVNRAEVMLNILNWFDGIVSVAGAEHTDSGLPAVFDLHQNYPNPLRLAGQTARTRIDYQLPAGADRQVTVAIYDLLGRSVRTLIDRRQSPGFYQVQWDGTNNNGQAVTAGVYFYRLTAGDEIAMMKKIAVVR